VVHLFPARAEDPKSKTDDRPQYERLLKGDDDKKAAELNKKIGEMQRPTSSTS